MTSDEFRIHGKAVIDWIADYMDKVEQFPVRSGVKPGSVRALLPDAAPERPEKFDEILADVSRIILPGITHWQSPNFFAYFPANASPPSILGDLLSSGLGVQGMLWSTSPACTELEAHLMDWLVDLLGLPASFGSAGEGGGVIQDTASSASLAALLAARERATDFDSNANGVGDGPGLVAYVSTQAHSSIEKAIRVAGVGSASLVQIPVDHDFAMDADALRQTVERDVSSGRKPFFVCATIGTTSSAAVDPVRPIGEIARDTGMWLHVDAAYAGSASICPELRQHQDGLELADSYTFNPHKWLLTNFDCNCFFVSDRRTLINTFSILPEYLRNAATDAGEVIDYRDWHIQLGRRFRALKLWFVLRSYGAEQLREHIRNHVRLAQLFARWVEADTQWELAAPVHYSLVCFRHKGGDEINEQIMDAVNESGSLFLTHTRLDGKFTLRLAIGARTTEQRHVEAAWSALTKAAT